MLRTIDAVIALFVFFAGITDMNGDAIRLRLAPFEIQTKADVIVISGELPEYATTIFVRRDSYLKGGQH